MTALLVDPSLTAVRVPSVRAVSDGRPPSSTWPTSDPVARDQPRLVFEPSATAEVDAPRPRGYRVVTVDPPWGDRSSSGLPDPRLWSASLALALAEAVQGRRPISQLSRWVDEQVHATLAVAVRRDGHPASRPSRPAVLRSVRLQFPATDAVEVAAHVQVDGRSRALAFRLEGWYDRWLCTALELGPRGL